MLTPKETPRGSHGHVLLSPGRTITESLNALAASTAQQLEEIWDEVGYNPQERASQLSDLLVKFRDQCAQKISEEQAVAETFKQTISDSKMEMKSLGDSLKVAIDPRLVGENKGQTLTDELADIETALDGLRADAAAAKADLQEQKDYLVETHEVLGWELDKKWHDIDTDLTYKRREDFQEKVKEMKEEVTTRTAAIIQLLRDCQHLMSDLGIDGQSSSSDFDRKISGSLVRSKDSSFIMASKLGTDTCTGISSKAFDLLTKRASELSREKRNRKNLLQDMGSQIAMLWEQLRVPEEEQRAFTESVKGLGMDTIHKGENELERLKILKGKMLGNLIAEARETIKELWSATNATDAAKEAFPEMSVEDETQFDGELLEKHDEYIRTLQNRLEQMKPILRLIERREDIVKQRFEYEELQKDSDRLKQRGAAMAKQLMEEEKMARRIKKELPKLTKILKEKLVEWTEVHGEEFQFNGEVYDEMMARQEEEWVQYKKAEMQLKLKKKQEEQNFEESKYMGRGVPTKKKRLQSRPLADSNRLNESRPSSRVRSRNTEINKPVRVGNNLPKTSRLTT